MLKLPIVDCVRSNRWLAQASVCITPRLSRQRLVTGSAVVAHSKWRPQQWSLRGCHHHCHHRAERITRSRRAIDAQYRQHPRQHTARRCGHRRHRDSRKIQSRRRRNRRVPRRQPPRRRRTLRAAGRCTTARTAIRPTRLRRHRRARTIPTRQTTKTNPRIATDTRRYTRHNSPTRSTNCGEPAPTAAPTNLRGWGAMLTIFRRRRNRR